MRIGQSSAINFAAQIAASVIGFVATVYLARELGADTLGIYFVVIAVVIWLKMFGGMGLSTAIKKRLSEQDPDGEYIAAVASLQLAAFTLIALGLYVGRQIIQSYLNGVSVWVVIGLLGISLAFQLVLYVLDGQHKVHLSALLTPLERLVRSLLQIGAVFLGYALSGLLFGYGFAALFAALVGVAILQVKLSPPKQEHFVHLLSYAQFSWLGRISSRAFASMDTLVLGMFVASSFIGIYEIAWNLASILAVFGTSVSRALFPELSRLSSGEGPEAVAGLVEDGLRYAGLFLIPGLIGATVVGDRVLAIYGAEFARGHNILIILIGARLLHAYGAQVVNAMNAIDRPEQAFRTNGAFVLTNVVLNVLFVYLYGWYGAAVATAVSGVVVLVVGYQFIDRLMEIQIPITAIGYQTLAAIAMGIGVYAGRMLLSPGMWMTASLVLAGGVVYIGVLLSVSRQFRGTVQTNLPY
jgi:O-antigen/teichoic acid export membrane protein